MAGIASNRAQPAESLVLREAIPLVLVDGFLGTGTAAYWGPLATLFSSSPRRIIVVAAGGIGSVHDRACEIYYQLQGGCVDFGLEHSAHHKHARYGREYPVGLYPQWSHEHPVHVLGHSLGGPTLVHLQHLLATHFFAPNTSAEMLTSLTGLSAPLRGSTVTYILGARDDVPGRVRPLSVGSFLSKLILAYQWTGAKWPVDFQMEHWRVHEDTLAGMLARWCPGACPWMEGTDNAAYDLCVHAREEANKAVEVHAGTWYRSYVTCATMEVDNAQGSPTHHPRQWFAMPLPMTLLSWQAGKYGSGEGKNIMEAGSTLADAARWRANDGLCNVVSQYHPKDCSQIQCRHHANAAKARASPTEPGVWETVPLPGHHLSILPYRSWNHAAWSDFFVEYFEYLARVESVHLQQSK